MKRFIIATLLGASLLFPFPKQIAMADTPAIVEPPMDARALALGTYFEKHNCPLLPYVDDFIKSADKYNIDWRLLPAISIHESSCGKHYPPATNNPFGWQSARVGFASIPVAIDFINERLANGKPYAGKSIRQKLSYYCPNPTYPSETLNYMNLISNE